MTINKIYHLQLLIASALLLNACTGVHSTLEASKNSSNPWTMNVETSSTAIESDLVKSSNSYCLVTIPETLRQDQELRVEVSTQNVAKFQVSADGAAYIDLETANGIMTWPGNSFAVGSYSLRFRGLSVDQTIVPCDPANKVVTVQAVSAPPPTTPPPEDPRANAVFSLHQLPLQYNKSSSINSEGNLVFVKTDPLTGFKNQFAPNGVPGCVMGYPEYRNECETVNGGFGFDLKGITNYLEFKVYIPAGTTFFGLSGFLPQTEKYAAAVRLGARPNHIVALTDTEYQRAKEEQNRNTDFAKLLAGEERLMVHDGGGSISFSGIARLWSTPLNQGQWLYVRVLNGSAIHGLGAIYEVNLETYKREFNRISFSAAGDPL